MKNKKGFISVSIIYSFFLVFLLIMLAMLADYLNKRYILETEPPGDAICEVNSKLPDCIRQIQKAKNTYYNTEPPTTTCVNAAGMYHKADDYTPTESNYSDLFAGEVKDNYVKFAGYYWRIVRINGNNTVRLIYAGQDVNNDFVLSGSNEGPYITSYDVDTGLYVMRTRYNYALLAEPSCTDGTKLGGKLYNFEVAVNKLNDFEQKVSGCANQDAIDEMCDNNCEPYTVHIPVINEDVVIERGVCKNTCKNWYTATDNVKSLFKYGVSSDALCNDIEGNRAKFQKAVADKRKEYDDYCIQKNVASDDDSTVRGAYLPNRIGYMNNTLANIARYDSKYDNQDNSEIKTFVDWWYNDKIKTISDRNSLSTSTVFCGDKNESSATVAKVTFDGNGRIAKKNSNPELSCGYSGNAADFSGDLFFQAAIKIDGFQKDWGLIKIDIPERCISLSNFTRLLAIGNKVINLSRYNVNNTEGNYTHSSVRVYSFKDRDIGYYKNESDQCINKVIEGNIKTKGTTLKDKLDERKAINDGTSRIYYKSGMPGYNASYDASSIQNLGNGDLTYPIALLSADEAVLSGVRYANLHDESKLFKPEKFNNPDTYDSGKWKTNSKCKSYLMDEMINTPDGKSNGFWTMTLSETGISKENSIGASYFAVMQKNFGTASNPDNRVWIEDIRDRRKSDDGLFMRPVINVKADAPYCMHWDRGKVGTIENPIEIGVSC